MVRDLILDMKERDLLVEDKSYPSGPVFDTIWGNIFDEDDTVDVLICNIIVPEAYWESVKYEDREFECSFLSDYVPETKNFRVRMVALKDGKYSLFKEIRGMFGNQAVSYALSRNVASPINASMLPYVDIDGEYRVKMVMNEKYEVLDKAYIYSSKLTDLRIDYSDDQASQLLSLCGPGNSYRYPTTGVGITGYLNSVIAHSDLADKMELQFEGDGKPIHDAYFDNRNGMLDILCAPEHWEEDDWLDNVGNLGADFFQMFDDDYVRRNVVIAQVSDVDFIETLDRYPRTIELLMFRDSTTSVVHIASEVTPGKFDATGDIVPDSEYFIVTATLEGDTIVMFDDMMEEEIKDAPVFIVNDKDETRLYTALVEQPYWITETCNKCMILKQRATLKYMVRQDRFKDGKGLYVVHRTSENIKNMVGIVQDINTGRLLGVVSNNTNIKDITLDEITQHIYATQTIQ